MIGVWDKNKQMKKNPHSFWRNNGWKFPKFGKTKQNKTVNVQMQETQQAPSSMNLKKYLCPETS